MQARKLRRPAVVALAIFFGAGFASSTLADDAQQTTKDLQEQLRIMQQRIEQLSKQVESLTRKTEAQQQAATAAPEPAPAAPTVAKAPAEPRFEKFLKGFYGTLDVSFDDTTKGINGLTAYQYSLVNPNNPNSGAVQGPPKGTQQVGILGYMPAISTNKSQIGYRNTHKIGESDFDFLIQVETSLAISAAPGLRTSYVQQSNVVQGAIGLGDTFIGIQNKEWGKLKVGTTYSPYKKSTDRLNPFSGMLGDYAVVMGNSGGDNRVEFGTRLDHSAWYESPTIANVFSFDLLVSPGQNRTFDNVIQSAGSPDCNGGNEPGSGNLLLNCDDGGFGAAYSADLKVQTGGFYGTVAYELHRNVNRNSDGIGSNSLTYGYLFATNSPLLDFNSFNTVVGEFPGIRRGCLSRIPHRHRR